MGQVSVTQAFSASVYEAERCWLDTDRWPQWIDGLERVVTVSGAWPQEGSQVIWESGPAGRGRVRELVTDYQPRVGLTVAVEDDSITGVQGVAFDPVADGVQVTVILDYSIKRRSPFTPLIDRVFVRGPMTESLSKTLRRFGWVLADSGQQSVG